MYDAHSPSSDRRRYRRPHRQRFWLSFQTCTGSLRLWRPLLQRSPVSTGNHQATRSKFSSDHSYRKTGPLHEPLSADLVSSCRSYLWTLRRDNQRWTLHESLKIFFYYKRMLIFIFPQFAYFSMRHRRPAGRNNRYYPGHTCCLPLLKRDPRWPYSK